MKVVHILPYDSIGGVETAARSLPGAQYDDVSFYKYYLANKSLVGDSLYDRHGAFVSENNPLAYFFAVFFLFFVKPDLVIASLWRSCIVLLFYKLFRPRVRCVVFLHLAVDVHLLDKVLNRLAMAVSTEIWTDSNATLLGRVPEKYRAKARVISFLIERNEVPSFKDPAPRFIFWGRLHPQKGLERALRIFSLILEKSPEAYFYIVGPDGGELSKLQMIVSKLGLSKAVDFGGAKSQKDILTVAKDFSFYLQTSLTEGMALSVIEAMQMGLVPVVSPVGEISRYCDNGRNSIFVGDERLVVELLIDLLHRSDEYRKMSKAAVETWKNRPLYREDVLGACRQLLVVTF